MVMANFTTVASMIMLHAMTLEIGAESKLGPVVTNFLVLNQALASRGEFYSVVICWGHLPAGSPAGICRSRAGQYPQGRHCKCCV